MEALPKGVDIIFENREPYIDAYTFLLKYPFNPYFPIALRRLVGIGYEYPVIYEERKWTRLWTEDFDRVVELARKAFR